MSSRLLEYIDKYIRELENRLLHVDYKIRNVERIVKVSNQDSINHIEVLLRYLKYVRDLYITKLKIVDLLYELYSNGSLSDRDVMSILNRIDSSEISDDISSDVVTDVVSRLRDVMYNLNFLRRLYSSLCSYSSSELS